MSSEKREPPKCSLTPINLHDESQFEELRQQRVICGWDDTPAYIKGWRNAMDAKLKSLFWINLNTTKTESKTVGHISLDSEALPPDPELALANRSVMTISTFFIFPEYRAGGIGKAAMRLLEDIATKEPYGSPDCKAIALTSISRRYVEDDSEDWRGFYKRRGMETPAKGSSNEDWYIRQGYVKFKEEPRYRTQLLDGTEVHLLFAFLRKEL
jgi:GNAT superfamily N-acetyltransferase